MSFWFSSPPFRKKCPHAQQTMSMSKYDKHILQCVWGSVSSNSHNSMFPISWVSWIICVDFWLLLQVSLVGMSMRVILDLLNQFSNIGALQLLHSGTWQSWKYEVHVFAKFFHELPHCRRSASCSHDALQGHLVMQCCVVRLSWSVTDWIWDWFGQMEDNFFLWLLNNFLRLLNNFPNGTSTSAQSWRSERFSDDRVDINAITNKTSPVFNPTVFGMQWVGSVPWRMIAFDRVWWNVDPFRIARSISHKYVAFWCFFHARIVWYIQVNLFRFFVLSVLDQQAKKNVCLLAWILTSKNQFIVDNRMKTKRTSNMVFMMEESALNYHIVLQCRINEITSWISLTRSEMNNYS